MVLQASEAASGSYASATKTVTFSVAQGTPTMTFAVPGHTFGDVPFAVSADSNSTGAFTYSVLSGPATIGGSTVTLTGVGTVVLQASEAASDNYASATTTATFSVAPGTPMLMFSVPGHIFGDAPFVVSASSNVPEAFIYTVVSGPATVAGSTVTLTGAGTVVLQAAEAASANYASGTKAATFSVAPATPALTFAVSGHTFGDAPFAVSAGSNAPGAFVYSVVSGPATVAGSTVTLTGAGTVVLGAAQAASTNYTAASITTSLVVVPSIALAPTSGTTTVTRGSAATFPIAFTPGGGATYPDALTFSVTGMPSGATATFSPASIAAGSGAVTVTLTVQTSAQTSRVEELLPKGPFAPIAFGFVLLPLAGRKVWRKHGRHALPFLMLLVITAGGALGLSGCGGASTSTTTGTGGTTAPQSYTLVVTATDAATNVHSTTNLTLIVQ